MCFGPMGCFVSLRFEYEDQQHEAQRDLGAGSFASEFGPMSHLINLGMSWRTSTTGHSGTSEQEGLPQSLVR